MAAKFGDFQKKIDEEEAKFRSEQEVRNRKQMDELAKIHPTPTVADLNEAMSVKDAAAKIVKPAESKATTKASEQEPSTHEGSYKTRASTSRRE